MASRKSYPLDHATHLPILIGLGMVYPIKRVLEYGAGFFSTPLFLSSVVFPKVELVVSVEPDLEWIRRIQEKTELDNRLFFQADDLDIEPGHFDMVLIDNSPAEFRAETIRKIVRSVPGLVVVHDSEYPPYKKEITDFVYRFDYSTFNPETSICCNKLIAPSVGLIGSIIMYHPDVAPDDIPAWTRIFKEAL